MKKSVLLILLCLLLIAPAAQGQESGYPSCGELESLIFLTSFVDPALLDLPKFESIADFVDAASTYLESRESDIRLVPLCGVAIEMQRQGLAFKGDLFGQMVMRMADVPTAADPYVILVPDNDERLAMNEERFASEEYQDEPAEREIPACSMSEMFKLDSLASQLEVTHARALNLEGGEKWLLANYQILKWREENLEALPQCLEAIEAGLLLTELATDSAAQFAFSHAGFPDAHNPFVEAVNSGLQMLQSWRDHLTLTRPEHAGAKVLVLGVPSQLPPCKREDIDRVHSAMQEDILPLLGTSEAPEIEERLTEYAESHMALRYGILSEAPACAEIFEGLWLARELLGDRLAWASFNAFGYIGPVNPFGRQVRSKTSQLNAWMSRTAATLRADDAGSPAEEGALDVPACRSGEFDLTLAYLLEDFDGFMTRLFSKGDDFDALASIAESFTLRDSLWAQMPRCKEALEIGLMMRQIAGDLMSSISMNLASVDRADIPYADEGRRDMDLIDELRDEAMATASQLGLGAQTYYVTANTYANIRACASTECAIVGSAQRGEAIEVLDDSSDWYEIRLEDGGTGYIAGFLASKTRP